MMLERLAAARDLMADDGAIFVEIDDTELGPLQVTLDALFGREARVSTVTVVRSAATGHKARNAGPVNVTDYLLVYAKDRSRFRANPVLRERMRYDAAYSTWLENPGDPIDAWRFVPLRAHLRRGPRPCPVASGGPRARGRARRARRAFRAAQVRSREP